MTDGRRADLANALRGEFRAVKLEISIRAWLCGGEQGAGCRHSLLRSTLRRPDPIELER